jgi:two-component system NarL family sensor kinase
VFSAARELLANVVRHAEARVLTLRLVDDGQALELAVEDDGRGFTPELLGERLADGHIGLATQRVRVEAVGGTLELASELGVGTRAVIRLPG